jgi:flagellar hook assembly protein FlgD
MVHSPIHTSLKIYNILGEKVRTLIDEPKRAGSYEVIWDRKDDKGKEMASGIYFYQLKAGDYTETKKMLLLK